ncbi:hypothetical protein BSY19_5323 (plasmid) [Bosea sp. RAC05]|nr:hypothetical protein BSY19_5323 [Bosea sp. RAC05]
MTATMRELRTFFGEALSTPISAGLDPANCVRKPVQGERQLGAFILPPFQREAVWRESQKVALIESVFIGLPFGGYVVNHGSRLGGPASLWLLDGQQRWTALTEFVEDGFAVRGRVWSELDREDQFLFRNTVFPCHVVRYDDEAVLRDLYDRLAYGGTAHAEPEPESSTSMAP